MYMYMYMYMYVYFYWTIISCDTQCTCTYRTNLLFDLIGSFPTEIILPLLGLNGVG